MSPCTSFNDWPDLAHSSACDVCSSDVVCSTSLDGCFVIVCSEEALDDVEHCLDQSEERFSRHSRRYRQSSGPLAGCHVI